MTFKTVRALRVDPADFKSMGADLNEAHTSTTTALDLADDEIDAYTKVQQGNDADLIVSSARATLDGVRSSVAGYPDLVEAFDAAYSTTFRLDGDSDALWDEVVLFDGEMTPDDEAGFEQRFDDIRTAEESAMATLADAIEAAETGDDIELDAGVPELIGRLIGIVEDADTDADLAIAQLLVTDYAEDGDFDTSKDVQKSLEEGDFSAEEIELLMAEGVDSKVRDSVLDEGEFPDGFSGDELEKLLSGDIDSDLAIDILEDPELEFPDEELMESVHEAMVEGDHPKRVGIDQRYFPKWYLDYLQNDYEIQEAERRRDDVDGVPLVPDWLDPSDREEPRADIDKELGDLREKKREFEEKYNIGKFGEVDEIEAAATVGERLGGDYWKGKKLAEVIEFDGGDVDRVIGERSRIISEIGEHPESSTGFFNGLGPEDTHRLGHEFNASALADPESLEAMSVALGVATRHEGKNQLDFDGAEFIDHEGGHVVEELLIKGDFDEDFWVDASVTFLEHRSDGISDRSSPEGNLVLSKASDDPEMVVRIVEGLGENDPTLAALLDPRTPYQGEEIAEFLAISGQDPETAGKILGASADVDEFKDPGTAAGVDAIMAQHVTIMYDEDYLASHGIYPDETGRLSQEEMERLGFGPEEWNSLLEKVNEHGFGGFVAAGNERLMFEAMQNDIEAPEGGDVIVRDYERFAYVSGVLNEQEFQARLAVAEKLDDDARAKNQRVQIGAAVATALLISGTAATPTPIDDVIIVGTDIAASTGISMFFPEFWETGRAFDVTEEDRQAAQSSESHRRTQGRLAWLQATGEEIEVPVKSGDDSEGTEVSVTVSVVTETVKDPETGVTTTRPVMRAVDENGDAWVPGPNESLDWDHLNDEETVDGVPIRHPVNQNGSNAVDIVGSEQGADEVQARESGTEAPGARAESSFEGVNSDDRKAVDSWLGL